MPESMSGIEPSHSKHIFCFDRKKRKSQEINFKKSFWGSCQVLRSSRQGNTINTHTHAHTSTYIYSSLPLSVTPFFAMPPEMCC
mmetsp:Transcript_138959/g.241637  ORF Transcript_138959/g.241637 Transcript_138959/m.241637 type:complete len:84 (+) Transcript_138959:1592-1843(+)